jgi:rubrerythrin
MINREAPNATEMGTKKYRERIHKESKFADTYKNLPYTFSKPKKSKPYNTLFVCPQCGEELFITEDTICIICSHCKTMSRTKPPKE